MCSEKKKPEIRLSKEQQRWIAEVDKLILGVVATLVADPPDGTPPLDKLHQFAIYHFTSS